MCLVNKADTRLHWTQTFKNTKASLQQIGNCNDLISKYKNSLK